MPEKIVNLIDKIAAAKGQDYAKGMVDMANILAPDPQDENSSDGESDLNDTARKRKEVKE